MFVVLHTGRREAIDVARRTVTGLIEAGLSVRMLDDEAAEVGIDGVETVAAGGAATRDCEIVVVIGGDGTILRGAELTRGSGTPLLGVNLGHMGFLAEAERDDLDYTVDHVVKQAYDVEERLTLDVAVRRDGEVLTEQWALNEAAVEKAARERMLELVVEIDGRPLSRWACDGVVCATPTGSTAYAFSAGGPVVWPEVEALLMAPISAHALFARPMVIAPDSVVAVEVLADTQGAGVLWCDGRRTVELPPGARIEVRRGELPVRLARLHRAPFTDRLVAKFDLPTMGWRGGQRRADRTAGPATRSAGSAGNDRSTRSHTGTRPGPGSTGERDA
ncbi:MAG: NAD kinase [Propionibacteriales bacterium]|nr:NAD kinase [Propionibacteriales bacterium]